MNVKRIKFNVKMPSFLKDVPGAEYAFSKLIPDEITLGKNIPKTFGVCKLLTKKELRLNKRSKVVIKRLPKKKQGESTISVVDLSSVMASPINAVHKPMAYLFAEIGPNVVLGNIAALNIKAMVCESALRKHDKEF